VSDDSKGAQALENSDESKVAERAAKYSGLRPWKPGQSGNPSGRPKGSLSLTSILRKELHEGNKRRARELVRALLDKAADGHFQHLHEVIDRIDGPVVAKVEVQGQLEHLLDVAQQVLPPEHYEALLRALSDWRDR
jgi:hypothetical protein